MAGPLTAAESNPSYDTVHQAQARHDAWPAIQQLLRLASRTQQLLRLASRTYTAAAAQAGAGMPNVGVTMPRSNRQPTNATTTMELSSMLV